MMKNKEIFGIRLRQARIAAKLSMEGLCRRIKCQLSKQAISKYEQGVMMPSSTLLLEFSNALNRDIDFFFRPITFDTEQIEISFRKREGIGEKDLKALKVNIQDEVERVLEIDEILSCYDRRFHPIDPPIVPLSSRQDMEICAQRVREQWCLGDVPINNIQVLLEECGIRVIMVNEVLNFDGVSAKINGKPIMVLNSNVEMFERQRFTAMHELGHILFNEYFANDLSKKEKEKLCDAFAGELLLPTNVIKRYFTDGQKVSLNELIYVQKIYGISVDAVMHKLKEMKIVSDKRYTLFYVRKNSNPLLKDSVECSRFVEERISILDTKVYSALAQNLITEAKAASLLKLPITTVRNNLNTI